ncbi:MAG: transglutaminase-like domain-containing protein [Thiobacillaceae bacterium]
MCQGYSCVQAIRDWVKNRVNFLSSSSTGNTSAVDALVEEVGVCRDFAHRLIALCRAVNIPARFVAGIDYGSDRPWDRPTFMPMLRRIWATAATFSTPQALPSRWALCALAPALMGLTRPLPQCSAECAAQLRQYISRQSPIRRGY